MREDEKETWYLMKNVLRNSQKLVVRELYNPPNDDEAVNELLHQIGGILRLAHLVETSPE